MMEQEPESELLYLSMGPDGSLISHEHLNGGFNVRAQPLGHLALYPMWSAEDERVLILEIGLVGMPGHFAFSIEKYDSAVELFRMFLSTADSEGSLGSDQHDEQEGG